MDYRTVLAEVESWPVDDRVRLVQDVWERLQDQGFDPEPTDELKAELDRRIAALDQDPESGIPWQVVRDRLAARYGDWAGPSS